ncbi:MAG TPA: methylated-DNA--[protein]-cysteine S-methyltransferase [Alphaproteobacteria bacterium]
MDNHSFQESTPSAGASLEVEEIRHAVATCSLGHVLVAAGDGGVCAIFLGDNPAALGEDLRHSFPDGHLVSGDARFAAEWVAPVVRLIEAPGSGEMLGLPLTIHGSPLQRRVWDALCEIPSGETRSYTQVARRLGLDRGPGPRDVAAACAANKLAVAIPCHRVIAADGRLSGYRWGVARKARLLARERALKNETLSTHSDGGRG